MIFKKIKFYFIFIFLLGAVFFSSSQVSAQVQQGQWWYCLTPKLITQYDATVSGTGLPIDTDIYIVECRLKKDGGYNCTTGVKEYDSLLNVEGSFANVVDIMPSPIYRTSTGNLTENEIKIHDEGPDAYQDQFYFFGVVLEEQLPEPITPQVSAFYKSQQIATLPSTSSVPANEIEKCVSIWWDPYGRVFDAKSLEPLPNTKVTILDESKKFISSPQVRNPIFTLIDGIFNFLVQEGTYFLQVDPIAGYIFSSNPNLNPNYTKAYKNIYKPDEPIYELIDTEEERAKGRPDPEHRDIPLDPGNNLPYESCPKNMVYGVSRVGYYTRIAGRVSHPLTKLTVSQGDKVLLSEETDIFGKYELNINNKLITSTELIIVTFTKVDLTGADREFPDCNFSVEFQPVLPYLEGYAYDENGNIISNAVVSIILDSTKKTLYKTTADSEGFFKVYPHNLPIFSYKINVVNPINGKSNIWTASDFVNQNNKYLIDNKINLQVGTKEGRPVKGVFISDIIPTSQSEKKADDSSQSPNPDMTRLVKIRGLILTIIIFVFLIIGVVFYFIKKGSFFNRN